MACDLDLQVILSNLSSNCLKVLLFKFCFKEKLLKFHIIEKNILITDNWYSVLGCCKHHTSYKLCSNMGFWSNNLLDIWNDKTTEQCCSEHGWLQLQFQIFIIKVVPLICITTFHKHVYINSYRWNIPDHHNWIRISCRCVETELKIMLWNSNGNELFIKLIAQRTMDVRTLETSN